MASIETTTVNRVDYCRLNQKCAYCGKQATVIRVTTLADGSTMVSTMCDKDRLGEIDSCLREGMVMAGHSDIPGAVTDSVLVAPGFQNASRDLQVGNLFAQIVLLSPEELRLDAASRDQLLDDRLEEFDIPSREYLSELVISASEGDAESVARIFEMGMTEDRWERICQGIKLGRELFYEH